MAASCLKVGDIVRRTLVNQGLCPNRHRSIDRSIFFHFFSGLRANVLDLLQMVGPITNLLEKFQKASLTVADAVDGWLTLEEKMRKGDIHVCSLFLFFNHPLPHPSQALVTKRGTILSDGPALAAFCLHPVYGPKGTLPPPMQLLAQKWMSSALGDRVHDFDQWMAGDGVYKELMATIVPESAQPYRFWQTALRCGAPPIIFELGMRLGKARATSADIERLWSTLGHVYGTRRTKMTSEKAFQLAYLYRRANTNIGSDDIEDPEQEDD